MCNTNRIDSIRMTSHTITFRLPATNALRFAAVAKNTSSGTPSKLLRQLVDKVLEQTNPAASAAAPAKNGPITGTRQINVRLPDEDVEQAKTIAAEYGGLTPWLRALIKERIGQTSERPAKTEVAALYAASVELWHIGNNLNQIAREFHGAKLSGMPMPAHKVTPELLTKLVHTVEAVAARNQAVITAARRRGNRSE